MVNFRKRTTSSFGISIGTGLMLESLFNPTHLRFDPTRQVPNVVNHDLYKYHFINMITIVRNIIQAFEVKIDPMVILSDRNMLDTFIEEIHTLYSLYSGSKITLVLYYNDVVKISGIYNKGKERPETQPLILNKAIQNFLVKSNLKVVIPKQVNVLEKILTLPRLNSNERMLLTTNIPCDMCSPNEISMIDTHTGLLYGRDLFYKKYNPLGTKDMSNIPFNEKLLYIIGDKNLSMISTTIFRAYIQEYSISNKWNYLTGPFAVQRAIDSNKELKELCKNFKSLY